MRTILHTVDLAASGSAVYEKLTTEGGLAGWWSTRVSAETDVGGRVSFEFIEAFNPVMEIVGLDPDRRVEWRCVGGHEPWTGSTLSFEIDGRDGASMLVFRQEYARDVGNEMYGRYNFNWGHYLASLKELCETGTGKPHRGE